MKNFIFRIALLVVMIGTSAITFAKEKPSYPKVLLTLNDGTAHNGFLRCNLHSVNKKVLISETEEGEKATYQVEEIDSLVVTYPNGETMTLRPIYVWEDWRKKDSKTPRLASICYSSNNMVGYKVPSVFESSTTPVPSNHFQTYSITSNSWRYYKQIKREGEHIHFFCSYIPSKKAPKMKSFLSYFKANFEKEEYQYIVKVIEQQGITAEMLSEKPWLVLEILDKKSE